MEKSNHPIRVLLVDDQQMFREGIRSRLGLEPDIEVVGEAASGEEALDLLPKVSPSLVVVDIRLPDMSGIELSRLLRQSQPDLKIVVLTGYDYDQYVRAMARVGIDGYILKDTSQDSLVSGLREAARGGTVLTPRVASKVMKDLSSYSRDVGASRYGDLTVRELEVIELMCQELTYAEIAKRLSISPRTAEAHIRSILAKLDVQSRSDAVRVAMARGLIK